MEAARGPRGRLGDCLHSLLEGREGREFPSRGSPSAGTAPHLAEGGVMVGKGWGPSSAVGQDDQL